MASSPIVVNIDQQRIAALLDHAAKKFDSEQEVVLDFSSIRRISSSDVRRLAEFAHTAEAKHVRVLLCNVNVDIYKAFKLSRLAREFCFLN